MQNNTKNIYKYSIRTEQYTNTENQGVGGKQTGPAHGQNGEQQTHNTTATNKLNFTKYSNKQ